jgi:hypothetical protein
MSRPSPCPRSRHAGEFLCRRCHAPAFLKDVYARAIECGAEEFRWSAPSAPAPEAENLIRDIAASGRHRSTGTAAATTSARPPPGDRGGARWRHGSGHHQRHGRTRRQRRLRSGHGLQCLTRPAELDLARARSSRIVGRPAVTGWMETGRGKSACARAAVASSTFGRSNPTCRSSPPSGASLGKKGSTASAKAENWVSIAGARGPGAGRSQDSVARPGAAERRRIPRIVTAAG